MWGLLRDPSVWYTKINPDGNVIVDNKKLFADVGDPQVKVDSVGNIHLFCSGRDGNFHYAKLDNNGNVLINSTSIASRPNYSKDFDTLSKLWDVLIDKNDCIHLLWLEENSIEEYSLHYIKMDHEGTLLADNSLRKIFGDNPLTLCPGTVSVFQFSSLIRNRFQEYSPCSMGQRLQYL